MQKNKYFFNVKMCNVVTGMFTVYGLENNSLYRSLLEYGHLKMLYLLYSLYIPTAGARNNVISIIIVDYCPVVYDCLEFQ